MFVAPKVSVLLLASALALPSAAPALCTVVNPTMSMEEMTAHRGAGSIDNQNGRVRCNFAECAMAPVAPVVYVASSLGSTLAHAEDLLDPLQSLADNLGSPPTPPPQV